MSRMKDNLWKMIEAGQVKQLETQRAPSWAIAEAVLNAMRLQEEEPLVRLQQDSLF